MNKVKISHACADYLLSVPAVVSAVDLSEVLDNAISYNQISRLLYSGEVNDKKLYLKGKRFLKSLKPAG